MTTLRTIACTLTLLLLAFTAPLSAHAGNGSDGGGGDGIGSAAPGDEGSDGSGGGGGDGGGAELPPAGISVPRVMLTEFISEPGEVVAGDAITVSFTLQNMSRSTRVNNLKVTLTSDDAGAFLPVNGSSSTYISTIRAEHSVSRTMTLRTLPSLEEKPYGLTLQIEYEDALANPYQSTEQVAIPVGQTVRADTSTPQVMPEQVMVGQQASVTFSINNLGRNKLFNARVTIPEGQAVAPQEVFVGTIEPGASGTVDLTVQAVAESFDPIAVQVSYEDAGGVESTLDRTLELAVAPEMVPEDEEFGEEWPVEEDPGMAGGLSGTALMVIAGAILLALVLVLLLVGRARRRRRSREQDSDMALLDGDPLVPADGI